MTENPTSVAGAASLSPPRLDGVRPTPHAAPQAPRRGGRADFAGLLSSELRAQRDVKLSAHARARIEARGIHFGADDQERLRAAVDTAAAKGARQSLVMLDALALIVNIPSRTVITAMESDGARGTVFTNIDSALIAQGGDADLPSQQPTELDLPGGSSSR